MPKNKIRRLLLLQPPIQDFYETEVRLQPIGLCYLKAVVGKYLPHIQVVIRDYHHGYGRHSIPIPKPLAYLKKFYPWPDKSPFSTFHHYYHFGATFERIAQEAANANPDLVAISALFTPYYQEVLRCAAAIKSKLPVPILVGGSHASAAPETILEHPAVDFVICGEGERPLIELLKALESGSPLDSVPNLGFKAAGRLWFNVSEDNLPLTEIPMPDLSDFPLDTYTLGRKPLAFVVSSRGCPHRCAFCSVHQTFGHCYRVRPVEDVLQELVIRYDQGFRVFDFEDDNLTFDLARAKRLCQRIIHQFPQQDIQCLAMNGVSYASLDAELLGLMKSAGFTHLNLSLVSSSQDVQRESVRPHTLSQYAEVVHEAARLGFEMVSYLILGLPHETLDSMIASMVLLSRMPVLLGVSPFYLIPGSPIAGHLPAQGADELVRARLTAMGNATLRVSHEEIYTLFIAARIVNLLKSIRFPEAELPLAIALDRAKEQGARAELGTKLLEKLLAEQKLYAATPQGWQWLRAFDATVFASLWQRLHFITTQGGKKISL